MQPQDLEDLQRLDPVAFEGVVKKLFEGLGYEVETTSRSGDEGVDLILRKGDERSIAQCKRYKGQVGQSVVRDFYGTVVHEKAKRGFLVTTGTFSLPSQTWAQGKNLVLVDGPDLAESMSGLGIEVIKSPRREPRRTGTAELTKAMDAAKSGRLALSVVFIGAPPPGHTYSELADALGKALNSGEVSFTRGDPLARAGDWGAKLSNAHHGDLLFGDDINDEGLVVALSACTGKISMTFGRGPGARELDLSIPFVNVACSVWQRNRWRRLAERRGPALRELEVAGLIEVPVEALDWDDLERSLTGDAGSDGG